MIRRINHKKYLVGILCLVCGLASAQVFRALISGIVLDPSGSAIPGATVSIKNVDTNLVVTVQSGADGTYVIPQLPPGTYDLSAEAKGFKKYTREQITLNAADKARVDVQLGIGAATETVTVTAELTGIESNSSVTGQLLTGQQMIDLPVSGRSYIGLLQLAAGVIAWNGTTAWGNGRDMNFMMHGGRPNANAFLMDGAPLGMQGGSSYIPLEDAIAEMKIATPTSDASLGLSGGGVVNVTMKSGTNQFHGTLSEFLRNEKLNAWTTQAKISAAQNPLLKYRKSRNNVYSAMVSGSIIKNKLFWTAYYEGWKTLSAGAGSITLPTLPQRGGDFSQTFNAQGQQIVMYDPQSTRQVGSSFVRDAFPENKLPPERISPISRNMMSYVPQPNFVYNALTNVNNFAYTNNGSHINYNNYYGKVDYYWNSRHRTFGSTALAWPKNFASSQNGIPRPSPLFSGDQDPATRDSKGAILDHVWTVNPTTILNLRVSWDYWAEKTFSTNQWAFDASKLGFQGPTGSDGRIYWPIINFGNYPRWGVDYFLLLPKDNYTAVADVSKIVSRHFLRAGMRLNEIRESYYNKGKFSGQFTFNPGFTQRNPQTGDTTSGQDYASFLLGYPASGSADNNIGNNYRMYILGLYIQDDFKVSPKLTLNFGLRWDVQMPPTERYNNMNIGFDPSATYQLGSATAKGGIVFADKDHRTPFDTRWKDFQPRFGMAYQVSRKILWRAGYGMSYLGMDAFRSGTGMEDGGLRAGFSANTPFLATVGGGLNSYIPNLPGASTFAKPFPSGFIQPGAASTGAATSVGQSITVRDRDYKNAYVHQFNLGFDYELPFKSTIEASYVGSRTRRIAISQNINYIPLDQRILGIANPSYLNAAVANPFYGASLLTGTSLASATISRSQSLLPYPQFTGVTMSGRPIGVSSYNALEMRLNKRFSQGLTMTWVYTFAKAMEATSFREAQYTTLEHALSSWDRTHHLEVLANYALPVGRGQRLGSQWGPVLDRVLGNWQYNIHVMYMNGAPLGMVDATPARDPRLHEKATLDRYFDTCTLLTNGTRANCTSADAPITWIQLKPNELRTYSSLFPNMRGPTVPQTDMSLFKIIPMKERLRLEFRVQAYNALNNKIYGSPNTSLTSSTFGQITRGSQSNGARVGELALRLIW